MDARDRIIEQRMARRKHQLLIIKSLIALVVFIIIVCFVLLLRAGIKDGAFKGVFGGSKGGGGKHGGGKVLEERQTEPDASAQEEAAARQLLDKASLLAAQYDYQAAISLLTSDPSYNINTDFQNAV